MASRVVLIALVAPVAETLHAHALGFRVRSAPLLGPRAAAPVAVAYEPSSYEPLVADYGSQPPRRQEGGGGLTIAMGGLVATLMCSASALSTTGTIATIAASAAGLFSFKVAKELNNRGVDRGSVSKVRQVYHHPHPAGRSQPHIPPPPLPRRTLRPRAPLPLPPHTPIRSPLQAPITSSASSPPRSQFGTGIIWRLAALVVYTLASIVSFGESPARQQPRHALHLRGGGNAVECLGRHSLHTVLLLALKEWNQ